MLSRRHLNMNFITSLVFGVKSSPFLAQFVSQYHAGVYRHQYPRAAEVILQSTYMDDSMVSVMDETEGVELYKELSELWQKAGMKTHKWLSNSFKVLENIPSECRASEVNLDCDEISAVKTLGVLWLATEDVFTFKSDCVLEKFQPTKRNFLKRITTLFDPLGLLSPFIVRAKVLMQEIWIAGMDWDDTLPEELSMKMKSWFMELPELCRLRVPRCLQLKEATSVTLQVFVDASQDAYGAVVYMRSQGVKGNVLLSFVEYKTRVAPLQSISIPHLELMAAVLGEKTGIVDVPTKQNPADYLTRGTTLIELSQLKTWWEAPMFLWDDNSHWPRLETIDKQNSCSKELKRKYNNIVMPSVTTLVNVEELDEGIWRLHLNRFSSWRKLTRILAWVLRFINNCT